MPAELLPTILASLRTKIMDDLVLRVENTGLLATAISCLEASILTSPPSVPVLEMLKEDISNGRALGSRGLSLIFLLILLSEQGSHLIVGFEALQVRAGIPGSDVGNHGGNRGFKSRRLLPLLWGIDIQGRRRWTSSHFLKLHGIFDDLIDQRLTGEKIMGDFLSTLIKYYVEQQGRDLPRQTIRSLLTDLFVGGSDTSSNTVEWAMAELLRNPRCMTICRTELAATFTSSDNIEESKLLHLPYLQAIVKETFRLHPLAPLLLPRSVDADTELCGYTVPRGGRIFVNAWAIGMDDTVWVEPDEFRPERFLDSGIDYRGRDFELIPFGAGRRICPGLPLAFRTVPLMLASLLLPFEWTLPEGMSPSGVEMTEKFGLTLAKARPIKAIPTLAE